MLVLTRKLGEDIRIGDSVRIVVLEVRGTQVKLGIEAPPEVKVHRGEIYARIQEENRRAAAPNPTNNAQARGDIADKPPPQTGGLPLTAARGLQHLGLIIGGQPANAHS